MSAREAHFEAVNACSAKVAEIQGMLGALSDECRTLIGMVEAATGGDDCPTEAGRIATQEARYLEVVVTNDPNRIAETIDELVRYANGF